MRHKVILGVAVVLLLGALFVGTRFVFAQRPGEGIGMPVFPRPSVGRYVVAHSSAKLIVILDTATGDLYKATPDDYKRLSERPKPPPPPPPERFFDKDKDKEDRFKDKDKKE